MEDVKDMNEKTSTKKTRKNLEICKKSKNINIGNKGRFKLYLFIIELEYKCNYLNPL